MPDADPRCPSIGEITPDVMKRCIRAVGHRESDHVWLEAVRTDGKRILATWVEDKDGAAVRTLDGYA